MKRAELVSHINERRSFLCVGLDPELSKLPPHLLDSEDPVFEFNRQIIDATRDYCVAYKPNLAFFEALGPAGWISFERTVKHIGKSHFIIADAKRGDIGNTSRMYADAFFNRYGCDAVTIAPYMGEDSLSPFLETPEKWAVVLALTSNKGSNDFQRLHLTAGEPLWETVLSETARWGSPENMMYVVGATHPDAFARVRELVPDHFLLVPGVGAQGGDLAATCRYGLNRDIGLLINSSRGIIYADHSVHFAEKAAEEARKLQLEMASFLG
jgi:orotidine-5'-phosphate decarboxylase